MTDKAKKQQYRHSDAFKQDVRLIVDNCETYNGHEPSAGHGLGAFRKDASLIPLARNLEEATTAKLAEHATQIAEFDRALDAEDRVVSRRMR